MFRFHRQFTDECSRLFAQRTYRFIYQRMSLANYSGVVLSRRFQVPLILEYNGSEVWCQKNWGKRLRYEAAAELAEETCLRHAHVVVTVSDVLRDELISRGVDASRVVSYPNCIDPTSFDPARFPRSDSERLRESYGLPKDALVALFLGTFGKWHGADVLAQAIRQLVLTDEPWLQRHKLRFLLVGDGAMMPVVRDTLNDERIAPYVALPGLVPQQQGPAHLAAADILLSPHVPNPDGTPFFGSPTKLFEYMAMGRAILASDLNQVGEVLRPATFVDQLPSAPPQGNERCRAVLTQPGNVAQLIAGLKFLVENPAWRESLGREAREACLKNFTWRHHVEAIQACCPF